LEYAHSQAQQFLDKALSALTSLKESGAKEALIETAKFMAGRTV
jgi:geranylgeranyl pyrophosphate synthase